MYIIHNMTISSFISDSYLASDIDSILSILYSRGTFVFHFLDNGLFPASNLSPSAEYTGYGHVWIRDNVFVAYAHYLNDQIDASLRTIRTLARYFLKHKWRLESIIAGTMDYQEPMNRPHIRFNGSDLSETDQKWAHAENDALGYFIWIFCKIYIEEKKALLPEEKKMLALFARYFHTIRYWEDEDSGHWEEARKIEASSIGVVIGALEKLKTLMQRESGEGFLCLGEKITTDFLDVLIAEGKQVLEKILPAECIQPDVNKYRRYDAALLFLTFPIKIVDERMTKQILSDVIENLQGDYGIRRYLGDSFWFADYKKNLRPELRTADFSDNISTRDRLLKPGQEAQWCIFDPIISIIYGLEYQRDHDEKHLKLQIHYFNRSLGQLTEENSPYGGFKCPELYYLENGHYVPNDTVPLLWTQANLRMAFQFMKSSLMADNSSLVER
ncbi:MAG: glycoside hydrolase family 15 protein [Syntrophobacteraceae bacterium]